MLEILYFLTDHDLVMQYGLLSPLAILRGARLSLLCRILHKNDPLLISMLNYSAKHVSSFGWVRNLSLDINWLVLGSVLQRQESVVHYIKAIADSEPRILLKKIKRFSAMPFSNFDAYEASCVHRLQSRIAAPSIPSPQLQGSSSLVSSSILSPLPHLPQVLPLQGEGPKSP